MKGRKTEKNEYRHKESKIKEIKIKQDVLFDRIRKKTKRKNKRKVGKRIKKEKYLK